MNIVFVGDNIKNQESLPLYGVGPYLIGSMLSISVLGIILSHYNLIPVFKYDSLNWLLIGLAIVLILDAAFLWLAAVRISNITKKIENGELVTDGVYALVRHPIYSAWLQLCTALILLVLPVIFWIVLSVAMAKTEEMWLMEKFGNDYVLYAQTTNRFIPFTRLR